MISVLMLLVLGLMMHAANQYAPTATTPTGEAAAVTLAGGYLLLTAFLAGAMFNKLRLPKLTGYLAAGVIVGPEILGFVGANVVDDLRIFNGVAVALIALTAGLEMDLRAMRPLMRSINWITGVAVVGTIVLLSVTIALARPLLPFMDGLSFVQVVAVSSILGVTLAAQSPAVVVALRDETAAEGPMIRTVMGTVVIADLVVIILFAGVSAAAQSAFGGQANALAMFGTLAWELFGSIGIGVAIGALVALYLRHVDSSASLFVVAVSFVVAEVGTRIHLDPLIVTLSGGILIRNATSFGDKLHHGIAGASLPIYVAFFAVAGATIHVHAIIAMTGPALLIVGVRAAGFLAGTRYAADIAGAPEVVRRFAGYGLLPQAGLALALALLFSRTFPQFGAEASALVFGVVALNELLAPVVFRIALVRSGEAGATDSGDPSGGHSPPATAAPTPDPLPEPG